jgi:hypothetical protein
MEEQSDQSQPGLSGVFRSEPLARARAMTSVVFFAAALLSAGGMLEFATGSPSANAARVASYWAWFFAFNFATFGGAALLGAFPGLARAAVKIVWALLVAALYAAAFAVWRSGSRELPLSAWFAHSRAYVPAGIAFVIGLLWRGHARNGELVRVGD